MSEMPGVRVNRKALGRLESGHPWIFSSDITDRGQAHAGDAVRVLDPRGRMLGTAHYSANSQITLRLLSRDAIAIDRGFLAARLRGAIEHRKRVVRNSNAYRLVHAEGDQLPGLIVDRYDEWLVVQLLDQGMDRLQDDLTGVLADLLSPKGIAARNDAAVRIKENLAVEKKVLVGEIPDRVEIQMNGLRMFADLMGGQKTGVFLDQRENYVAVGQYARGRGLDCFTATGGFALHMARGCESVEGVDSSAAALELAKANAAANGITNVSFKEADVLEYLPAMVSARRTFDVVVVDPPAFTKSRSAIEGAARGYKEVNLRALRLLRPGGILVSCSCSHHMSEARLFEVIAEAALDARKELRVLERRTQPQDHPILLTVPETHYLKCLIFEVLGS